jgi:hypothetical protein
MVLFCSIAGRSGSEFIHWRTFDETDNGDRCYNEFVTKIYILLEDGLIPGLDEFEHNN